jgi:hypothetical protein
MLVLVNTSDGKCYLFREGYVRTSSKLYTEYDATLSSDEQIYMQLTNNAIQKNGEEYEKYEEGNILSLQNLFNYISGCPEGQEKTSETLFDEFKARTIQIVQHTIKAVKGKIRM